MRRIKKRLLLYNFLLVYSLLMGKSLSAQNLLTQKIASLEISKQSIADVLEILSNKGNFYFSYNSSIIKKDSVVTLMAYNKTVREILDFIFKNKYEFTQSGNYIIIKRAPIKLTIITNQTTSDDKFYVIDGYVIDTETGEKITDASVYEKKKLTATLTNANGYFKIKFKAKYKINNLTVSKVYYEDTTVMINAKANQEITISIVPIELKAGIITTISPQDIYLPDTIRIEKERNGTITSYTYKLIDSEKVEKTKLGRFLFSGKQRIQSMNLKKFFVTRPYQISFVPPWSTNGRLNAQVTNKFSLNALGGYAAGVNGFEVGGLFNINKKSMLGFQAGGIINLVGGSVHGVQIAGIHNNVLDSVHGLQVAGISNYVKGRVNGWQIAGIYNHAKDTIKGVQIAGIGNTTNKVMNGVQIGGIFNYAKKLHGVQIGLVNIADSSDGYSIGLINIVKKGGYHKLVVTSNETTNFNIAYKTGNRKLYSLLMGGASLKDASKVYTFGLGLGHDFVVHKKMLLSTVLSSQSVYLGSWDSTSLLNKFNVDINWKIGKNIALVGGTSFNIHHRTGSNTFLNYKKILPEPNYNRFAIGKNADGWIGWNVGIQLF
jgi:hypothetical protein